MAAAFSSHGCVEIPGTGLAALYISLGVDRNRVLYFGELKAAVDGKAQWRKVVEASDQVRDIASLAIGSTCFRPRTRRVTSCCACPSAGPNWRALKWLLRAVTRCW